MPLVEARAIVGKSPATLIADSDRDPTQHSAACCVPSARLAKSRQHYYPVQYEYEDRILIIDQRWC